MQIINIWWHSKKGGKFKSGGTIWIKMCEYNLKKSSLGHFFKKEAKIKRILAYIEKC